MPTRLTCLDKWVKRAVFKLHGLKCVLVRDLRLMFFDTNKNSRCSGPTTQHANQTRLTPLIKHGYCFQVLKNGVEVKLQRNALSVLEPPTGQEDDGDFELDNSSCGSDDGEKDNIFCKFYT